MLSHCANPKCLTPFLRLGQGKLFLVESDGETKSGTPTESPSRLMRARLHFVERYWLCDTCAHLWTLVHEHHRGIILMPLAPAPGTSLVELARV
jgi:hypothetical protein